MHDVLQRCEALIVKFLICVFGMFPLSILYAGADVLGWCMFVALKKRTKIALDNLELAFGNEKTDEERRRIARASGQNLLRVYAEFMYFARHPYKLESCCERSLDDAQYLDAAHARGKGVVYLTGHIGNWEMLPLLGGVWGIPLTSIGRAIKNRYLMKSIDEMRQLTGSVMIEKEYAVKEIMRALRDQRGVGVLIDQRGGNAGEQITFFGETATATPFPALMKIKLDCTMLPVFLVRTYKGKFRFVLKKEIVLPADITDKQEQIHALVQAYTDAVEEIVREYPEQWLWYHRRWRL